MNLPTKFTTVYNFVGQSPLHLAVLSNAVNTEQLVEMLLKNGADISSRDAELNTPLHCTHDHTTTQTIEVLLNYGADIDALNMYHETPLLSTCNAITHSSPQVSEKIRSFLDNGADINIENERAEIPFMILWSTAKFEIRGRLIPSLVVMMKHIKKLSLLNSFISNKNEHYYSKLLAHYEDKAYYNEANFVEQCLKELRQMAYVE